MCYINVVAHKQEFFSQKSAYGRSCTHTRSRAKERELRELVES
jgi:hypothetical protein